MYKFRSMYADAEERKKELMKLKKIMTIPFKRLMRQGPILKSEKTEAPGT